MLNFSSFLLMLLFFLRHKLCPLSFCCSLARSLFFPLDTASLKCISFFIIDGLSNIEITDGNIKSFERVAKKYRLDFALKKDSSTKPPTYYVFFKGQDTEMMNLAFKKYLGVQMNKKDKPSIMEKLMHFKDAVSKGKNRERAREQQKDRGQSL